MPKLVLLSISSSLWKTQIDTRDDNPTGLSNKSFFFVLTVCLHVPSPSPSPSPSLSSFNIAPMVTVHLTGRICTEPILTVTIHTQCKFDGDGDGTCKQTFRDIKIVTHSLIHWRVPNVKIVKNPSLVVLHCTFTMHRPRVHSISQWWIPVADPGFLRGGGANRGGTNIQFTYPAELHRASTMHRPTHSDRHHKHTM